MDTYYCGDPALRRGTRKEFVSRARTVLVQGGLAKLHFIESPWGPKDDFPLLAPPEESPDNPDILIFDYHLVERGMSFLGAFNMKTGTLRTKHCGFGYTRSAVHAVNVLREFYTKKPGIAVSDNGLLNETLIVGWLNYLFDEQWDNRRFTTLLHLYAQDPNWRKRKPAQIKALLQNIATQDPEPDPCRELLSMIQAQDKATLTKLAISDSPEFSVPFSPLRLLHDLKELLITLRDSGRTVASLAEILLASPDEIEDGLAEQDRFTLHFPNVIFPYDPLLALWREVFQFEKGSPEEACIRNVLEKLGHLRDPEGDAGLTEISHSVLSTQLRESVSTPIPKYSTAEFLANSAISTLLFRDSDPYPDWKYVVRGEEMIMWWTPGGDIQFSESFLDWMHDLRGRLDELAAERRPQSAYEFMLVMARTVCETWHSLSTPSLWLSTWNEFLQTAGSPVVQGAIFLMEELLNSCLNGSFRDYDKGALSLFRYGCILANRALRREVFGF